MFSFEVSYIKDNNSSQIGKSGGEKEHGEEK